MQKRLIYRQGVRSGHSVALTFDDGPNPPRTEQVLAILASANARASFFLLGKWVERFPETVKRIQAAGHLIGNHSYLGRQSIGDYDEAEAVIGHVTGVPSLYFRAHRFDYVAYFQSYVSRLPESKVVDANVDPGDWASSDPREIVRNVLNHPNLGPGAIIVMHDGAEIDDAALRLQRPLATIAALPSILSGLAERGLHSVRLDELPLAEWTEWSSDLRSPSEPVNEARSAERVGGLDRFRRLVRQIRPATG